MLEKRLADTLRKEIGLAEDYIEVAIFGYRLFAYSLIGYILIGLVAYLLGTMGTTLVAAVTASIFRIFSGGAHASSQKRCVIVGTVVFNVIGLFSTAYYRVIPMYLLNYFFAVTAVTALTIFIIYAPADTPGKPISARVQKNRLKGISVILLGFWIIFCNFIFKGETNIYKPYFLSSTLGLLWQSITLLPITYRCILFK